VFVCMSVGNMQTCVHACVGVHVCYACRVYVELSRRQSCLTPVSLAYLSLAREEMLRFTH